MVSRPYMASDGLLAALWLLLVTAIGQTERPADHARRGCGQHSWQVGAGMHHYLKSQAQLARLACKHANTAHARLTSKYTQAARADRACVRVQAQLTQLACKHASAAPLQEDKRSSHSSLVRTQAQLACQHASTARSARSYNVMQAQLALASTQAQLARTKHANAAHDACTARSVASTYSCKDRQSMRALANTQACSTRVYTRSSTCTSSPQSTLVSSRAAPGACANTGPRPFAMHNARAQQPPPKPRARAHAGPSCGRARYQKPRRAPAGRRPTDRLRLAARGGRRTKDQSRVTINGLLGSSSEHE